MVESINFYRNGLGFEVVVYGEETNRDVIFFNNARTKISLFQLEGLMKDINEKNPPAAHGGFGGITLAYNGRSKEEVDEVFVLAEKAGAKIVKEPKTVFLRGYSGYFQDSNGFYWEVDKNEMLIISES